MLSHLSHGVHSVGGLCVCVCCVFYVCICAYVHVCVCMINRLNLVVVDWL